MLSHDSNPLNIEAMQEAAGYFIGSHDFRNFCKVGKLPRISNQGHQYLSHVLQVLHISDILSSCNESLTNELCASAGCAPN